MQTIKPKISFLNQDNIHEIHLSSLKILYETGIRIHSKRMSEILKKVPGIIVDHDIIKFHPFLVNDSIQAAPETIDIFDRTGKFKFNLGAESETRFGIGVTNLWYEDPKSGEFLKFTRDLIAQSTNLGHQLDSYDVISTPGIIQDPEERPEDLFCTLEMIANTTKPLILLVSNTKEFDQVINLSKHLIGDIKEKPSIIPYFNPKTPLFYDEGTLDNIITSIQHGLPVIISNYGMMGSSTPIDPYKTLVLLNAELLAGLVFCQILQKETPVILGSLPAVFDMGSMTSYYDPGSMLVNLACADMMKHYQIPHVGTSGSGNGWRADIKGAGLLWMNHLSSTLGNAGLVPFVGGNFDSLVFSPTTVVYASEVIRKAKLMSKGLKVSDQEVVLKEIKQAEIGGNYFTSPDTLEKMVELSEKGNPLPLQNLSFDRWNEFNQPEVYTFLKEHTVQLINKNNQPEDHQELIKKGEKFISKL